MENSVGSLRVKVPQGTSSQPNVQNILPLTLVWVYQTIHLFCETGREEEQILYYTLIICVDRKCLF